MKGQKLKDKEKYVDSAKGVHKLHREERANNTLFFTGLDLAPIEFTKENVMEWLANSGWIEGLTIKYLGDQFPYIDDYILELYLTIFDKLDKLISIYEDRGILAFCGYIKTIIFTNCFTEGTGVYRAIRYFSKDFTVSCDTDMWLDIMDKYDPETMEYYKMNKTQNLI